MLADFRLCSLAREGFWADPSSPMQNPFHRCSSDRKYGSACLTGSLNETSKCSEVRTTRFVTAYPILAVDWQLKFVR